MAERIYFFIVPRFCKCIHESTAFFLANFCFQKSPATLSNTCDELLVGIVFLLELGRIKMAQVFNDSNFDISFPF